MRTFLVNCLIRKELSTSYRFCKCFHRKQYFRDIPIKTLYDYIKKQAVVQNEAILTTFSFELTFIGLLDKINWVHIILYVKWYRPNIFNHPYVFEGTLSERVFQGATKMCIQWEGLTLNIALFCEIEEEILDHIFGAVDTPRSLLSGRNCFI